MRIAKSASPTPPAHLQFLKNGNIINFGPNVGELSVYGVHCVGFTLAWVWFGSCSLVVVLTPAARWCVSFFN